MGTSVTAFLVVSLFALSTQGAFFNGNCPSPTLTSCSHTFTQFLNYPIQDNTTWLWKDYNTFINYTDSLFTKTIGDPQGLVSVCNALEQLVGCTISAPGQNGAVDCFSELAFLKRKTNKDQAQTFAGLFKQYKFRCGAGFYTILRENFPCVQRTIANNQKVLSGCLSAYINNVAHDNQNACKYIGTYMRCYSAVFNRTGCSFAGATDHWWACESAYQLTQAAYPACFEYCSQGGPRGLAEYVEKNTKLVAGRYWFKLPPIFKNVDGKFVLTDNEWVSG